MTKKEILYIVLCEKNAVNSVWLAATVYVDVSFAAGDEGRMVAYLLRSIEEQGE